MLFNRDIICISPNYWDDPWGTQQQMMWRLAANNRVFFLEVPISPCSPLTGLRNVTCLHQLKKWLIGVRIEKPPNLIIATPPPVLPFRYNKITNSFNQHFLARYLTIETKKIGFKKPFLVTFQADSGMLTKKIVANPKVYYCTDDWSSTGRWWQPPESVIKRESELIKECDFVIGTSKSLVKRISRINNPAYSLPNAVDFDLFNSTTLTNPADEYKNIKKPIIGFIGLITEHSFDPQLIEWLATRHNDWSFVLVGNKVGKKPDLSSLLKFDNVHFLGFKPIKMLPCFLAGMDVCIIPWKQTKWTKSAFSLKLFEYLAAGKPVVSTWTEEYLPFADMVYLAKTYEEFEQYIIDGLKENNTNLIEKRIYVAKQNTWDARVVEFSKIVNSYL